MILCPQCPSAEYVSSGASGQGFGSACSGTSRLSHPMYPFGVVVPSATSALNVVEIVVDSVTYPSGNSRVPSQQPSLK
jgi:hypothetical protein